jgi:hypothetical protein
MSEIARLGTVAFGGAIDKKNPSGKKTAAAGIPGSTPKTGAK